jgi:pilus assembly protein Flp/PilA
MTNLKQALKNFWNDEEGATAIEYGLLAALIAVVIIAGASLLGTKINCLFNNIAECIAKGSGCTAVATCT